MQERHAITAETEDHSDLRTELSDPLPTVRFMLAGNAYVTFQSRLTDVRYTYRVVRSDHSGSPDDRRPTHFVSVLVGPDDYKYLGAIFQNRAYTQTRGSKISRDAMSAVAFMWVWSKLIAGVNHPQLAVYHEGRCGRCGRRLTTPESIRTGLGPVCAGKAS